MTNPQNSAAEGGETPETKAFLASSPSAGSNSDGATLIRSLETRLLAEKRKYGILREALTKIVDIDYEGRSGWYDIARAALALAKGE